MLRSSSSALRRQLARGGERHWARGFAAKADDRAAVEDGKGEGTAVKDKEDGFDSRAALMRIPAVKEGGGSGVDAGAAVKEGGGFGVHVRAAVKEGGGSGVDACADVKEGGGFGVHVRAALALPRPHNPDGADPTALSLPRPHIPDGADPTALPLPRPQFLDSAILRSLDDLAKAANPSSFLRALEALAEAVKKAHPTAFGSDDVRVLNQVLNSIQIDMQGPLGWNHVGVASDQSAADLVGTSFAPRGHPAMLHLNRQAGCFSSKPKVTLFPVASSTNHRGYSRHYSSDMSNQGEKKREEEEEAERKRKEEEWQQQQQKPKEGDDVTFLGFIKRLLQWILEKATEVLNIDIKFSQWEKLFLSCTALVGSFKYVLYNIVDLTDGYLEARTHSRFKAEDDKLEAWKSDQELKRVRASAAASVFHASEAEQRRKEIERLTQLEEQWLCSLGHTIFKLRGELLDVKQLVRDLEAKATPSK